MTWALWCVLIAGLLPFVATGIAKWGRSDFDNHHPREWEARLEGRRARAHAAQHNSFEAFPLFAASVLTAHWVAGAQIELDILASIWIGLRLLYLYFYLSDKATLRSIVWIAALLVVMSIFVVGTR
jgi:uncharacterized MAPEG superfamily protein